MVQPNNKKSAGEDTVDVMNLAAAKSSIQIGYLHTNEHFSDDCGYCKGEKVGVKKGHASWGISATKMPTQHYQVLMDRGWRRCGTYYYLWDLAQSCCKPYTIRLDVNEFEPSNSQKKVLK